MSTTAAVEPYGFPDPSVPRPPAIELEEIRPIRPAADTVPGRARSWSLKAFVALLAYSLGWFLGAVLIPIGRVARWLFAAIALGWEDARDDWSPEERNAP